MKRMRYDQKVKAAIHAAVKAARGGGKSWADAFVAAQQAGYKGTLGSLVQFVKPSSKKASAPTKAKGTRKKRRAKRKTAAPIAGAVRAPAPSPHLDISALVHKAVTEAVVNALESLVATLKGEK